MSYMTFSQRRRWGVHVVCYVAQRFWGTFSQRLGGGHCLHLPVQVAFLFRIFFIMWPLLWYRYYSYELNTLISTPWCLTRAGTCSFFWLRTCPFINKVYEKGTLSQNFTMSTTQTDAKSVYFVRYCYFPLW